MMCNIRGYRFVELDCPFNNWIRIKLLRWRYCNYILKIILQVKWHEVPISSDWPKEKHYYTMDTVIHCFIPLVHFGFNKI